MDRVALGLRLGRWCYFSTVLGFEVLANATCQSEEQRIGCWEDGVSRRFSQYQRQSVCSRSAPFEYIQAKLGVVIALVTGIAKVDNWSSYRSRLPVTNMRGRSGGRGTCAEDVNQQQRKSVPSTSKFHGLDAGEMKDDSTG